MLAIILFALGFYFRRWRRQIAMDKEAKTALSTSSSFGNRQHMDQAVASGIVSRPDPGRPAAVKTMQDARSSYYPAEYQRTGPLNRPTSSEFDPRQLANAHPVAAPHFHAHNAQGGWGHVSETPQHNMSRPPSGVPLRPMSSGSQAMSSTSRPMSHSSCSYSLSGGPVQLSYDTGTGHAYYTRECQNLRLWRFCSGNLLANVNY